MSRETAEKNHYVDVDGSLILKLEERNRLNGDFVSQDKPVAWKQSVSERRTERARDREEERAVNGQLCALFTLDS